MTLATSKLVTIDFDPRHFEACHLSEVFDFFYFVHYGYLECKLSTHVIIFFGYYVIRLNCISVILYFRLLGFRLNRFGHFVFRIMVFRLFDAMRFLTSLFLFQNPILQRERRSDWLFL